MTSLLLLSLISGCDLLEEPPPPPPPEPEPPRLLGHTWEGNTLGIEGFSSAQLEVKCCSGGMADVREKGFPQGATIQVGDTQLELGPRELERVEIGGAMGDMPIEAYKLTAVRRSIDGVEVGVVKFTLPITIQLQGPSWAPIEATSPEFELKAYSASLFLVPAKEGPVVFHDEEPDDSPDTVAVLWRADDLFIIGEGTTLKDVDWVVAEAWGEQQGTKRCGGYSNVRGVPGDISIEVQLYPSVLTVHDRRTGEVLGSKSFDAVKTCPSWASGKQPGRGGDQDAMKAWLTERLAAGSVE